MSTAPITPAVDLPDVKPVEIEKPAAPKPAAPKKPAAKKAAPKKAEKPAPATKLEVTQADLDSLTLVAGTHKNPTSRHLATCHLYGSEKGKGYKDADWKTATPEQMKSVAPHMACARTAAKKRIAKAKPAKAS